MILLFPLAFLHFPYKTSFSSANPFGNTVLILYVYVCICATLRSVSANI